ncbi:retrovirus-related pol polyprotein from transposon TNT 1-94, partial [Tanacetum coccineum]
LVPSYVPAASYVPPTKKDLDLLFQPLFNEYFEPPSVDKPVQPALAVPALVSPVVLVVFVPVHSASIPSSTIVEQDAPSTSNSPSTSKIQAPVVQQGEISTTELTLNPQPHTHLSRWGKDHPLDNVIGNPSQPVSTRKQLAINALWCFYNSVLAKVEPKNFNSAVAEDCWFEAMQEEIHEFDRLDVWELVPPPDSTMIIALKWIYKVKLDEYGDVLKNKVRLVAKGYR